MTMPVLGSGPIDKYCDEFIDYYESKDVKYDTKKNDLKKGRFYK